MQKTADGRLNPIVNKFADCGGRQENILNVSNLCGDSCVTMSTQNRGATAQERVRVIVLTRSESESKENAGCALEEGSLLSRSLL